MAVKVKISCEMDDGRTLVAICDQRDFAAAEAADVGRMENRHSWVRFCAWNAMKRARSYDGSWEKFNERECVEAVDAPVEEPTGDDDGLDPGRKGPTDAT
jgi:hypothetical protein